MFNLFLKNFLIEEQGNECRTTDFAHVCDRLEPKIKEEHTNI